MSGAREQLPATETVPVRFETAETWPLEELLEGLLERQWRAVAAVAGALPALARAVTAAEPRIRRGGRLIYAGAGTSGRIAVQDAVELWPTFSFPPERVAFVLAGGTVALTRAVEGAEDDVEAARAAVTALVPGAADVLLALAASGRTPFVRAAVTTARARGTLTVAFVNDPRAPLAVEAEHAVILPTGGEFPAGSTRMAAATAQKIALNLFSTALMTRLGRVHRGRMVALRTANAKLAARARRLLAELTGADEGAVVRALADAGGEVPVALLILRGASPERARALLTRHGGHVTRALEALVDAERP